MKDRRWIIAGMLAVGSMVLAFSLDETVWRWVHENFNENTRPIPTSLKLPHRLLRSFENWGENVFIVAVLYAMWVLDKNHRHRVVILILSALLVAVPVEGVKRLTGRERPDVSGGRSIFHGPAKGFADGDFRSFPSGHTASAASYSGSLSAFSPPLRPVAVVLAAGCGGSRIWKERHFLSDCWGGGLFGFVAAWGIARGRRLEPVTSWLDQRLRPRGPAKTGAPILTD